MKKPSNYTLSLSLVDMSICVYLLDVGSSVFSLFSVAMGIFIHTFMVVAAFMTAYMKPIGGQGKISIGEQGS